AIAAVKGERIDVVVVSTEVDFKNLTEQEIKRYWQTGEPQDKAGAYGIQGIAGQFVKQIRGSYSAVVGLPLYETAQLLSAFGVTSSITQA
ncbi:MAG: septum formation protein, partial [Psychroserpens sp.]